MQAAWLVVTVAAVAAGIEVPCLRQATEFEGLVDVVGDGFLHPVHFLLGIEKAPGDRIIEKVLSISFELSDFLVGQLTAILLFVLEVFASLAEKLVLAAGLLIGHERFNSLADLLEFGLVQDGLT